MRHNHSPRIRFLRLILALFAAASAAPAAPPESLVLENAALRAEVVPAWAGRLLFLGRPKGPNLLWTDPGAADVPEYVDGRRQWRNFGGEKTWVGTQEEVWPLFATTNRDGTVWPPPAWFDAMPLSVIRADATNILLRSGFHGCRNGSWTCAIEREFTLSADRLEIRQSAAPRHLSAFTRPGRAMVYVSPKDWRPSPYVELEFAAYGPDAAHTLDFRILDSLRRTRTD